jgi:transcriptional regulator with XRE-family HTH domain
MVSKFDQMLFSVRIRNERIIERKISLRAAADEIGICNATLYRYECSKGIPDLISYVKVCDWLDVEIDTFFNVKLEE